MHNHREHESRPDETKSFWRTPLGWAFIGFAAIAGFFLVTEHTAHLLGWLPWLLILVCPLMHFFGHGHGGHKHGKQDDQDESESKGGKSVHQH